MNTTTSNTLHSATKIISAVGSAIRELGEIPSGHLYASLIGTMTFDQYNRVIGILKKAGLITEKNHLLKWVAK